MQPYSEYYAVIFGYFAINLKLSVIMTLKILFLQLLRNL